MLRIDKWKEQTYICAITLDESGVVLIRLHVELHPPGVVNVLLSLALHVAGVLVIVLGVQKVHAAVNMEVRGGRSQTNSGVGTDNWFRKEPSENIDNIYFLN